MERAGVQVQGKTPRGAYWHILRAINGDHSYLKLGRLASKRSSYDVVDLLHVTQRPK